MSNVDFTKILNRKADEVEKPKPIPAGTYRALVEKHEFGTSRKKSTPFCRVHFKLLEPGEDVDLDQYDEFGGDAKLAKRSLLNDFWLTEDSLFRLTEFMEEVIGLDLSGRELAELIDEIDGNEAMVAVTHSTSDDGKDVYTNINGFASVN